MKWLEKVKPSHQHECAFRSPVADLIRGGIDWADEFETRAHPWEIRGVIFFVEMRELVRFGITNTLDERWDYEKWLMNQPLSW